MKNVGDFCTSKNITFYLLFFFIDSFVPVQEKKKKSGCKLPWWFVFVGWGLLIAISGISTFFTLLYGFQYGRDSSIRWVITLTLSMFQSIFIIQPLKVSKDALVNVSSISNNMQ